VITQMSSSAIEFNP